MKSPHGDDGTELQSFAHNWEYYMNGAFGEELIQYTGFQTVKESDGDVDRRVYLSVNKFNATSDLHIRRDGKKEVYFTDNNGQVRVVIDEDDAMKKYDYKPFGGLYWSSDGSHLREGLYGSIYDSESELQMMGVRMYDTETGRFTTPDLLWSAFPSHTPYQYAYNSPLIWSDPSGLAPEKEKDREELQSIVIDWDIIYNVYNEIQYENGRMAMTDYSSFIMDFKEAFNTRFGESSGSSSGNRTGEESGAKNGQGGKTTGDNDNTEKKEEKNKKELGWLGKLIKSIFGKHVNDGDAQYAEENPVEAAYSALHAKITGNMVDKEISEKSFGERDKDEKEDEYDAYRHIVWSSLNAWKLGKEEAKRIGDAHENHNHNTFKSRQMDYNNNEIGFEIGSILRENNVNNYRDAMNTISFWARVFIRYGHTNVNTPIKRR